MVRVLLWTFVLAQEGAVCPVGQVPTGNEATPCCPLNQAPLRGKPGTCVDIVNTKPVFGTSGIQRPRRDPNTAEVSFRADLTLVTGKARREVVEAGLVETVPAVRACYVERLAERPKLYGLVAVQLTVKPNGEIEDAETNRARSTAFDEEIERCVHEAAVGVTLSERPGGLRASTVTTTWELHPPKAPDVKKAPAP
jgi:hypothetical protein